MLGPYILREFCRDWDVYSLSRHSALLSCDFTNAQAVEDIVDSLQPDAIIHLIALADVDQCEREPSLAKEMNAVTVNNLVGAMNEQAHLIYISTDQVYPDVSGPHSEGHIGPVNVYGQTKLEGEQYALQHKNSLVVRTNFFGPSLTQGRESLSDFFIKSFQERRSINLFSDHLFAPMHMETLSSFIRKMIDHQMQGIYNLGSCDGMSKANFALRLASHLDLDASRAKTISTNDLTGRARRTKDLRMDVSKVEKILGKVPSLNQEIEKL